jgi:hypothetical protein
MSPEPSARIGTMSATMIATTIADTAQMKRLTEFAADVAQLADERIDLQLRELIDRLHADLPQKRCAGTATSSGAARSAPVRGPNGACPGPRCVPSWERERP